MPRHRRSVFVSPLYECSKVFRRGSFGFEMPHTSCGPFIHFGIDLFSRSRVIPAFASPTEVRARVEQTRSNLFSSINAERQRVKTVRIDCTGRIG